MPRVEALRVHGCVQVVARAEHAVDIFAQCREWAGANARMVRDRSRVALDLVDAQKDRIHLYVVRN